MNKDLLASIKTPVYICEEDQLIKNLKKLDYIHKNTWINFLLALKSIAFLGIFKYISKYLQWINAASLFEAKLWNEFFWSEVHIHTPAYIDLEFNEVLKLSDSIIFNSINQWDKFKHKVIWSNKKVWIRINPWVWWWSGKYDTSDKKAGLWVTREQFWYFENDLINWDISWLHFHSLFENQVEDFEKVLISFERNFWEYFCHLKWLNFWWWNHFTHQDYDIERFISIVNSFRKRYPNIKDIYFEPWTAVWFNAGILIASVLDIIKTNDDSNIVILNVSAEAHMPDTIIMPYKVEIRWARDPNKNEKKHNIYLLRWNTCLSNDIIWEYVFNHELSIWNKIIIEDQLHYTFVKTNMFNWINHPSLGILKQDWNIKITKQFGYDDFKNRF